MLRNIEHEWRGEFEDGSNKNKEEDEVWEELKGLFFSSLEESGIETHVI